MIRNIVKLVSGILLMGAGIASVVDGATKYLDASKELFSEKKEKD